MTGLGDLPPDELEAFIDSLDGPLQVVAAELAMPPARHTLTEIAESVLPGYHQRPHTDHLAGVLASAVEDVEGGNDRRIIVEMPPGLGKSSICTVALPLWALSRHPDWEVVTVSAEASLATKFSRDCRRAVTEGHVPGISVASDSSAVTEWETTAGGSMIARGVGGQITGRRARVMVIDDPVKNLADAHSRHHRDQLWDTWQSVLKTRLRPGSLVVLVMTRWHEDDLAGRLIQTGEWERVSLPALAEAGDQIGRTIGEPLLSPQSDETPEQALTRYETTRSEVGPYVWDALYQQRPSPPGGAVFHSDWWQTTPAPAVFDQLITSWDLTFGSQTGDYAVGQVWGRVGADCYLLDLVRGRWSFTDTVHQIQRLADAWPDATAHLIEKAANGAAAIDTLTRKIPGILAVKPTASKEIRALAVAPMVEAGNVHLPERAGWLNDFHSELAGFPSSAPHDDIVDALTQALDWLRQPRTGVVSSNRANGAISSNQGFRGRSF